ncbi:MAG: 3-hydroxyacyl-CoA dehydrogenase/enoyl-CoA hydratase/3-hydroxybutyryl-CoA epimerase [Psychromonas sp.]|jgi:3-hydroxyacyl-CoA dehydrogenase/enoyl-CoA hydratase/3-hydroxybutyryl-CoA epimerase|uniref:3-hydroxyacyl-CoA dehydrogenase NAD-binding domain-containing protein n=1 Tax=Psychromonas sp. TaxID=1884585 RepID=UPI0039E5C356
MNFTLDISQAGPMAGVAILTFDFPGERINKLDSEALLELREKIDDLAKNNAVKLLVFRSAKKDIFIVGADINEIKDLVNEEQAYKAIRTGQLIIDGISKLPFPTLAVINGVCLGGGCELALACTYRIATDNINAIIGLPEVSLGIIPGFGGCVRLPKLIGLQAALQLILSAKPVPPKKALRLKLVDHLYNNELEESSVADFIVGLVNDESFAKGLITRRSKSVKKLSQRILEDNILGQKLIFKKAKDNLLKKTKGQYPAPLKALETIEKTLNLKTVEALEVEARVVSELAVSEISKNLIQLFFTFEALKKETGITETNIEPKIINQVAVLGAGVMGGGIAWLFSKNDIPVRLKDIEWDAVSKGYETAAHYYGQLKKVHKITDNQIRVKMNHIAGTVNYNGFKRINLAVEAVVENMEVKQKVLAEVEAQLPEEAILASNTSSLSITEMAVNLQRPENFIGMHFFNPVNRMPLVEIIPGEKTSQQTIITLVKLAKQAGKTPIVVANCAGFLVNRILIPFLNEAALMLEEGGVVSEMDDALETFGLPMGPFVLADEVGIDIGFHVASILEQAYGDRMKVSALYTQLFKDEKLLGKKAGVGFYLHKGKEKSYNEALDKIIYTYRFKNGITAKAFQPDEIVDRCILVMVNEAAKCLQENIVNNPAYLDMAMILGTGFPAFTGGLLKYADNRGIGNVCDKLNQLAALYGERFLPAEQLIEKAKNNEKFYN